jgi:mycofactocin system glycosyltransferase
VGKPFPAHHHPRSDPNRDLTWRCRLVGGVHLRRVGDRVFVVGERPLTVVEVRPAALRLLNGLRAGAEVTLQAPSPRELRLLRHLADLRLVTLRAVAEAAPTVTVVIPVRDRPAELASCLASLTAVRYPRRLLDLLVVDDGSDRPPVLPDGVRLLRLRSSLGPAGARNAGARETNSDLLAFLDSDCLAEPGWLEGLLPELADPEVAAVGGRILAASQRSWLERYEAVRSPLDLGGAWAAAGPGRPVPYLVTANLIVRRADFEAAGGFDERLRFGEDVELCWRLHRAGRRLVYQPAGRVRHRHRGGVRAFVETRASYARSEAALLARHPEGERWLAFSAGWAAAVLGGVGALLGRPRLLAAGLLSLAVETAVGAGRLAPLGVPRRRLVPALLRGHAAGLYWAARQLARYYGLPLAVASLSYKPARGRLALALAGMWAAPVIADWRRLRPRQSVPAFLAAQLLDDTAYQYGLLQSCWRGRTLRPLRMQLRLTGGRPPP